MPLGFREGVVCRTCFFEMGIGYSPKGSRRLSTCFSAQIHRPFPHPLFGNRGNDFLDWCSRVKNFLFVTTIVNLLCGRGRLHEKNDNAIKGQFEMVFIFHIPYFGIISHPLNNLMKSYSRDGRILKSGTSDATLFRQ